jgi:hypothetical protein
MSIINVDTSFVNVSVGPYVIDEFWVNTKGFSTGSSGATLVLPGLYDQGASILSCSLVCPTGAAGVAGYPLNNGVVSITATGNAQAGVVLYSALGTGVSSPSGALGATLPQDSWLVLTYTGSSPINTTPNALVTTNVPVGLCVKWTKLTETQNTFGL